MNTDRDAKIKATHEQSRGFTDAELIACVDAGAGNSEIREKFNCSQKTIRLILRKNGRQALGRDYSDTVWTKELTEQFLKLRAENLSSTEIGLRLGVTANSVIGKSHRMDAPLPAKTRKRPVEKHGEVEALLRNGLSAYRVAETAHVSLPFVRSLRNALGIPIIRHGWLGRRAKPRARVFSPKTSVVYNDESSIAEFIARNGVTRCPAAASAPTTGHIPTQDSMALRAHHQALDDAYRLDMAPRMARAAEASKRALALRATS